jgi:hypothetical protein
MYCSCRPVTNAIYQANRRILDHFIFGEFDDSVNETVIFRIISQIAPHRCVTTCTSNAAIVTVARALGVNKANKARTCFFAPFTSGPSDCPYSVYVMCVFHLPLSHTSSSPISFPPPSICVSSCNRQARHHALPSAPSEHSR